MFKVGIVGCGGIGMAHARSWSAVDGVKVAAAVDLDPAKAKALADVCGAEPLTDIAQLPSDLDAVSVVTPPQAHYPVIKSLLERGFNVFSEKPLTTDVAQGEELVKLAEEKKCLLGVGFKMRYEPIFAEAKKLLEFFNDTETELAVLAVPLIKDEKVTAVNGEIVLTALSENFVRALRLTDKNGRRAEVATGAGALKTDADEGILRYAYLPAKKTLDGESDFRCGVPEKLFVNGVVSRYYFDRQLFEEAAVYKKEYEAAALCVRRLAGGGKFRARRWR